ncbi:MAG TPA: hypothetical protein VGM54_17860 [Chthoniobacter sp.]|jgi:hypothetical protein
MPLATQNDTAVQTGESSVPLATVLAAGNRIYWPGWLLAFATTSIAIGIIWDISWHVSIGRDTFWTPAHMAIYLGGVLGGCVGGWLAFHYTFLAGQAGRAESVGVFGARAPLGAWVAMWGAVAMITSAPFDDWWHNAYGLDVRIISPPHVLLGLGMLGINLGALFLGLAHQNRVRDALGDWLFIYVGGIFLTLASVFVMEYSTPNLQHAAAFYEICAATFTIRVVTLAVAGRISWPATRAAGVYLLLQGGMTWILPLFPAQPKLAPIFHPITHMVPPAFPVLIIFPALAIDLILRRTGTDWRGWRLVAQALALGAAFVAVFTAVQWFLSAFLLTPWADNWFFVGNRYFGYTTSLGEWSQKFWNVAANRPGFDPFTGSTVLWSWGLAAGGAWLGLLWGSWMKRVQR